MREPGSRRGDEAGIPPFVIYRFGNLTLDIARRELRRGTELVTIELQVFDVLKFLIDARDRVVSRDDLLDAVWHDRPGQLDAYDLLLRGYALLSEFTVASMGQALTCFDQALAIDPSYAQAMAAAAYCHAQRHFQGWAPQDHAMRVEAVRLAWHAAGLAPNDAQVLWMSAFAIWNMAQDGREGARDLFSRSLLLNPNSAMALTLAGWIETMCGNQAEGRAMVERAHRLNPRDPRGWLMSGAMAIAAVVDEDYADALRWAERALAQNQRFAVALRVMAVASVKLGQMNRARQAVQALLEIEPGLTVSGFFARISVPLESMARAYAEALTAAGLPA